MAFSIIKEAIRLQSLSMSENLFVTDVNRDKLWETYLSSFPEGSNPIFRERTEHDCSCCRQFVKTCGNLVSIVDNKLVSIWDIEVGGHYQAVVDAMAALVKSAPVKGPFLHYEHTVGVDKNYDMSDSIVTEWEHFFIRLPESVVAEKRMIGPALSNSCSNKQVLKRGFDELSLEAAETILELIDQGSLYRGEEHKTAVEGFAILQNNYKSLSEDERDNFCWAAKVPAIRNTVIGSLLIDLSDGVAIDIAVKSFEVKVAPTNYKRPKALITKGMIDKAQKQVEELGIGESLHRRFANIDDITVNNIIFADRAARAEMNVFDDLKKDIPDAVKNLDRVEEVGITTFINDILPRAESVEVMLSNAHIGNLMSLIAPANPEAPNILKWKNNFSWAYKGELADSMKERVKSAGGNVEGVLRFSIQWNDGDNNQNDFDAHCIEPDGNLIYYSRKRSHTGGNLDVDITQPGSKAAVENITWPDINRMLEGEYQFIVHNYSHNGGQTGFTAELEYDGKVYSYAYNKELRNKEKVLVVKLRFSREKGVEITESLQESMSSREVWGLSTNHFHRVSVIMNSPNHWDGEETGNRHFFFIIDNCLNDSKARGFFNEFLNEGLRDHRKVFEVLGSKLKADRADHQLSGLGFSSTQKNQILCKVTGSFSRVIKINI